MLTTGQENAVRAWVESAILDCPELTPIPLARIVWSQQDFPDRAYPYALISYTGTTELGASPGQRIDDGTDEMITHTSDESSVSVTIVTKPSDTAPSRADVASSYVRELRARTRSFAGRGLVEADLAVRDINVVPDVSRLQGGSQWESRAVIDLTLGHSLEVREEPGIIETVEVTGTTTPPTPSQTFTIPA